MAFTAIGCISASEVFATQSWPNGTKVLGPVALPNKFRGGQIFVDVSQLNDLTTVLDFSIEMSLDGGANFVPVAGVGLDLAKSGYSLNGGVLVDGNGAAVRIFGMSMRFPEPANLLRQIRGVFNFSNALGTPQVLGMTVVIW